MSKKINLTKAFLQEEYIKSKKSSVDIAKKINCSSTTIQKYLNEYNIPTRTPSNAQLDKSKGKNNPMYGRTGKHNPNWKSNKAKERQKCHCINCNKPITFRTYYYRGKRCSSCATKNAWKTFPEKFEQSLRTLKNFDRSKLPKMNGSKNPNWKGGISKGLYSQDWTEQLKEQIRQRDNYTCQLCDKTQKQSGKTLNVHHIDYDKKNCSEENLISLCKVCHTKTNYNRKYWEKLLSKGEQYGYSRIN